MAVRITKKELAEIQRLNKNTRAKLNRIEKRYGVREDITVKAPKTFTSRKELNAYKNQMRSFTNRYNQRYQYVKTDEGAVTRDVYNELKRKIKEVNRERARAYKDISRRPVTVAGEKIPGFDVGLRAEMRFRERGSLYEQFKPITLDIGTFRNREQAQRYLEKLTEHRKRIPDMKKQYKENYILAIQHTFGRMGNDLVAEIRKMPVDAFIEKVAVSDEYGEIGVFYAESDIKGRHEQLLSFFKSVNEG